MKQLATVFSLVFIQLFTYSQDMKMIEHEGDYYNLNYLFRDDFNKVDTNWYRTLSQSSFTRAKLKYVRIDNGVLDARDLYGHPGTYINLPYQFNWEEYENFEISFSIKIHGIKNEKTDKMSIIWIENDAKRIGSVISVDPVKSTLKNGSKNQSLKNGLKFELSLKDFIGKGFKKIDFRKFDRNIYVFFEDKLWYEGYIEKVEPTTIGLLPVLSILPKTYLTLDKVHVAELKKSSVPPIIKNKNQPKELVQLSNSTETMLNEIKFYALIIGNNNYKDESLNDLDQPIIDATKLYNSLTINYTFDPENVTFLKDATRRDMIIAFDDLTNSLTENDNLLIFYAGHGYWDSDRETGYWLPVDAERDITVDWMRNSTIQSYIEDIKAKHTLLVADACFGGGIFKTRAAFVDADKAINKLYSYDSRKAMTSGMLNEVPDRSVFMENLIERLNNNGEKYISSASLFFQFNKNVMNNSNNAPQFGTIYNTGDKGGDFIFILRDK